MHAHFLISAAFVNRLPRRLSIMLNGPNKLSMVFPSALQYDLLLLLAIFVAAFVLEYAPARVQPVILSDPSLQFPVLPDIVSTRMLFLGSFFIPLFTVIALNAQNLRRRLIHIATFTLGLCEAEFIDVMITNIGKIAVGRPRPFFATVCQAYVAGSNTECTGDAKAVAGARKSFPSGHSSLSMSGAIYLTLYLMQLFQVFTPGVRGRTLRLMISILPLLLSGFVAISRLIDHHHHYADVVGGLLLGGSIGGVVGGMRWHDWKEMQTENDANYSSIDGDAV